METHVDGNKYYDFEGSMFTSTTSSFGISLIFTKGSGYVYLIHGSNNMINVQQVLAEHTPEPEEEEYAALGGVHFDQVVGWWQVDMNDEKGRMPSWIREYDYDEADEFTPHTWTHSPFTPNIFYNAPKYETMTTWSGPSEVVRAFAGFQEDNDKAWSDERWKDYAGKSLVQVAHNFMNSLVPKTPGWNGRFLLDEQELFVPMHSSINLKKVDAAAVTEPCCSSWLSQDANDNDLLSKEGTVRISPQSMAANVDSAPPTEESKPHAKSLDMVAQVSSESVVPFMHPNQQPENMLNQPSSQELSTSTIKDQPGAEWAPPAKKQKLEHPAPEPVPIMQDADVSPKQTLGQPHIELPKYKAVSGYRNLAKKQKLGQSIIEPKSVDKSKLQVAPESPAEKQMLRKPSPKPGAKLSQPTSETEVKLKQQETHPQQAPKQSGPKPAVLFHGDFLWPAEAKRQGGFATSADMKQAMTGRRSISAFSLRSYKAKDGLRLHRESYFTGLHQTFGAAAKEAVDKAASLGGQFEPMVYLVHATPNFIQSKDQVVAAGGLVWPQVMAWTQVPRDYALPKQAKMAKKQLYQHFKKAYQDKPQQFMRLNPDYDAKFNQYTMNQEDQPQLLESNKPSAALRNFMQEHGQAVGFHKDFPLVKPSAITSGQASAPADLVQSARQEQSAWEEVWHFIKAHPMAIASLPAVAALNLVPGVGEAADAAEFAALTANVAEGSELGLEGVTMAHEASVELGETWNLLGDATAGAPAVDQEAIGALTEGNGAQAKPLYEILEQDMAGDSSSPPEPPKELSQPQVDELLAKVPNPPLESPGQLSNAKVDELLAKAPDVPEDTPMVSKTLKKVAVALEAP
ncbi:putative enterotoxin [Ophiocordyceps australis]|uniref:Putative enterotoxin n=1 Tax=Ophiocordyceps australis TaxID=1399860 RepID=A0A2C5XBV0_9HYPO|nr:putative enterotoxin [Ophiocordyceps australis]